MLVIRRRPGESLLIGDGIEVQVVDIAGGRVKLGITGPKEVRVLRKELKLTRDQNLAAARPASLDRLNDLAAKLR
jgi:carbon storage regulator